MPSVHSDYWEPLWKAASECETAICLHIGTGNVSPHCSPESPVEANITTMPMAVAFGAADWNTLSAAIRDAVAEARTTRRARSWSRPRLPEWPTA